MSVILIVFESRYGQTQKIAERVAGVAKARGHDSRLRSVAAAGPTDVGSADAVVVLAPVYDRKHAESIKAFALRYRDALRARPTAFFSVSLAAALARRSLAERAAGRLVRDFLAGVALTPTSVATFAGGLNYPAYPPLFRFTMRLACFLLRLPTDTSRNHELTDFAQVERATEVFLDAIERRTPRVATAKTERRSSGNATQLGS